MEDQNGAPSDGVAATPFSELISAWLDEGDRLDEKAIATTVSAPPVVETRTRRILALLRPALDRYRVVVLAGAGLIPFALFALTHRSAAVPAPALASVVKVATPAAPSVPGPERAATDRTAPPAAPSALPRPEIAGICASEAAPTLLGVRSPDPRPALRPHHHHHHHHAMQPATCGRGTCVVTRPASPAPHAGPATPSRSAAAPSRSAAAPSRSAAAPSRSAAAASRSAAAPTLSAAASTRSQARR
jgi:hypothetical protein